MHLNGALPLCLFPASQCSLLFPAITCPDHRWKFSQKLKYCWTSGFSKSMWPFINRCISFKDEMDKEDNVHYIHDVSIYAISMEMNPSALSEGIHCIGYGIQHFNVLTKSKQIDRSCSFSKLIDFL